MRPGDERADRDGADRLDRAGRVRHHLQRYVAATMRVYFVHHMLDGRRLRRHRQARPHRHRRRIRLRPRHQAVRRFQQQGDQGHEARRDRPALLKAANDRDKAAVNSQKAERPHRGVAQAGQGQREGAPRPDGDRDREYVSENEIDGFIATPRKLEAQLDLAEESIEQAVANMLNSAVNLGYTTIVSPVNGVVIEKKIDEGQTVASTVPDAGEMLVIGEDMDRLMHVYASVDEADVGLITAAMEKKTPVRFTVDAHQERSSSRAPAPDPQQLHHQPRTSSPIPSSSRPGTRARRLRPGMTANLSFTIDTRPSSLRVPAAALQLRPAAGPRPQAGQEVPLPRRRPVTEPSVKLSSRGQGEGRQGARPASGVGGRGGLLRAVPVRLGWSAAASQS